MPSTQLFPTTWTLRLKHARTTILLQADSHLPLSTLRSDLLTALHQTRPDGTLNSQTIPSSEKDVLLTKPIDADDLTVGWERLDEDDDLGIEDEGKGKGKAGAKKASTGPSVKDVGLKDGAVLAFKFRGEEDGVLIRKDGEEEMLDEGLGGGDENWDVVVPSLEETYGDGVEEAGEGELPG